MVLILNSHQTCYLEPMRVCAFSLCFISDDPAHRKEKENETPEHLYLVLKRPNAKWFTLCPHSVPSHNAHSPVQCQVWLFWAQQAENSIRDTIPQPQDLELLQKVSFGHVSLGTIVQTTLFTNFSAGLQQPPVSHA